jgi:hypothetical protein
MSDLVTTKVNVEAMETPEFRGSDQMQTSALAALETLKSQLTTGMTADDMLVFHLAWYLTAGYKNLRFIYESAVASMNTNSTE